MLLLNVSLIVNLQVKRSYTVLKYLIITNYIGMAVRYTSLGLENII